MISNLPKIIQKSYIGFDNLFDEILRINHNEFSNYPPFDILKKGSFNYQVKLAVAGFNKDEIEIKNKNLYKMYCIKAYLLNLLKKNLV